MAEQGNCDTCVNFVYDEDYEYYVCDMDLDEDDMVRVSYRQHQFLPVLSVI